MVLTGPHRLEGERARPLGSLRFDCLLAGLDLDKYWRFLFRGQLHLHLEGAGAHVGSQDVLQLLLLSLQGDHLLLKVPILQLPVVNLHLESLYLIKSSSTFLLFILPNLEVFSVLTWYLTMLGTHSNLARMTSPLLPSEVLMPHSQSLPTCSYWLPGWGWGWTPQ